MNLKNQTLLKDLFLELKTQVAIRMERINTAEKSHLQNYLYFICFPLFSFTESIIILSESGKNHSAKVLLRSLFEAHINIIYHQLGDSDRRLAQSAKAGFDSKVKNITELKELVRKYPNLQSKDPKELFSDEWLQNAGSWAKVQREGIIRWNSLSENDRDLDLKAKAIKCDQEQLDHVEPGHFERMYQVIYRQLSSTSHLNIDGIETFVSEKDVGRYLFDDGDDGCLISAQAIEICAAFTKDLIDLYVLDKEDSIKLLISKVEIALRDNDLSVV